MVIDQKKPSLENSISPDDAIGPWKNGELEQGHGDQKASIDLRITRSSSVSSGYSEMIHKKKLLHIAFKIMHTIIEIHLCTPTDAAIDIET